MSKKTPKKRRPPGKSQVKPNARSGRKEQGKSVKLLLACLVVLVIGLAIRFFWSSQHEATILNLRGQVISAEKAGDWPKVEELARDWAIHAPDAFEPWKYAAAAAMQLGDPALAVNYLSRIPDNAPVELFHELGLLQMERLVAPQASLATCLRTLKEHPKDVETHDRLMYFYTMTCQREKLRLEIQRAIDLKCETSVSYVYLFASSWLTFTNGYATNSQWLESAPENQTDRELYEVAAVIHLYTRQTDDDGNRKETLEDIQKYEKDLLEARERLPGSRELLAAELDLRCEAGDVEIVEQLLQGISEDIATDHRFLRYQGWLAAANGRWEQARELYQSGLERQPYDWQIQTELELVFRRLNDPESAAQIRKLAEQGRAIARTIQKSPSLFEVPNASLLELADYFDSCGMQAAADRLRLLP